MYQLGYCMLTPWVLFKNGKRFPVKRYSLRSKSMLEEVNYLRMTPWECSREDRYAKGITSRTNQLMLLCWQNWVVLLQTWKQVNPSMHTVACREAQSHRLTGNKHTLDAFMKKTRERKNGSENILILLCSLFLHSMAIQTPEGYMAKALGATTVCSRIRYRSPRMPACSFWHPKLKLGVYVHDSCFQHGQILGKYGWIEVDFQ